MIVCANSEIVLVVTATGRRIWPKTIVFNIFHTYFNDKNDTSIIVSLSANICQSPPGFLAPSSGAVTGSATKPGLCWDTKGKIHGGKKECKTSSRPPNWPKQIVLVRSDQIKLASNITKYTSISNVFNMQNIPTYTNHHHHHHHHHHHQLRTSAQARRKSKSRRRTAAWGGGACAMKCCPSPRVSS